MIWLRDNIDLPVYSLLKEDKYAKGKTKWVTTNTDMSGRHDREMSIHAVCHVNIAGGTGADTQAVNSWQTLHYAFRFPLYTAMNKICLPCRRMMPD